MSGQVELFPIQEHPKGRALKKIDPVDVPVLFDVQGDIRAQCWREGVRIIRALTGKGDGQARGCLGRLLKSGQDDCALVLHILSAAEDHRPVDPMAWLNKTITLHARNNAALAKIGHDWDLIPIGDLDANAARLMARDMAQAEGPKLLEAADHE